MNLDTLKSLQQRIRDSKGAERELDLAICKALGRAPEDAIWEVDLDLPPDISKWRKQNWTTPAYVEHMRAFKEGVDAAFAARLEPAETGARIKALNREWDFKNNPPFGSVPNYTTDPDGLGACVGLMRVVLPGWIGSVLWNRHDARGSCFASAQVPYGYDGPAPWPEGWGHNDNACRAVLDAIIAALIAKLEADEQSKQPEKAG